MMPELDFQRIHDALEMLSRRLGERGVKGEVCLFGGAAFIVEYYYPANQIPPRTRYFIETLFYSESQ